MKNKKVLFVRMMCGEKTRSNHFHLEVATTQAFSKGKTPKVTAPFSRIEKQVLQLEGVDIDLTFRATFEIDRKNLPQGGVIQLLSNEIRAAEAAMRLTSGTMEIKGSPLTEISWRLRGDDTVIVTLEADKALKIYPGYLVEGQRMMTKFFEVFIANQDCIVQT